MVSPQKLKEEQLKLVKKLILKDELNEIKLIAGADCAYFDNKVVGAIVVLDKNMKLIEKQYSIKEAKIQYKPGFLFYREGPVLADAYSKLENRPDVLLVDGNGILHPLKIGMATQLGILLNQPTIGVSKTLLIGEEKEGKILIEGEVRGEAVKTKEHGNPLYISPGHKITLKTSVDIVKQNTISPHKLPEPLHVAHRIAEKIKDEKREKI